MISLYSFSSYAWISFLVEHNTFIVMEKHLRGILNHVVIFSSTSVSVNLMTISNSRILSMRRMPIPCVSANWSWQRWPLLVPVGSRSQCQNVHRRTRWSRWLFMEMHCESMFSGNFFTFICMFLTLISSLPEYNLWGLVILFYLWG